MDHNTLNHDFNTCAACQKAAREIEELHQSAQLYGFEHPVHFLSKFNKCPIHTVQSKKPGQK
jgi:hypothetical protein